MDTFQEWESVLLSLVMFKRNLISTFLYFKESSVSASENEGFCPGSVAIVLCHATKVCLRVKFSAEQKNLKQRELDYISNPHDFRTLNKSWLSYDLGSGWSAY